MNNIHKAETPLYGGFSLAPCCPVACKTMEEVYQDCAHLNKIIPLLREKGFTNLNTKTLISFSDSDILEDIAPYAIHYPEFITFTGKRAIPNRKAFDKWFAESSEGKAAAAFKERVQKENITNIAYKRCLETKEQ